jgi:thymidine phosphorylase
VSAAAGVVCLARAGDRVAAGDPVLELRAADETRFGRAVTALDQAIEIGPQPPSRPSVILERIGT